MLCLSECISHLMWCWNVSVTETECVFVKILVFLSVWVDSRSYKSLYFQPSGQLFHSCMTILAKWGKNNTFKIDHWHTVWYFKSTIKLYVNCKLGQKKVHCHVVSHLSAFKVIEELSYKAMCCCFFKRSAMHCTSCPVCDPLRSSELFVAIHTERTTHGFDPSLGNLIFQQKSLLYHYFILSCLWC